MNKNDLDILLNKFYRGETSLGEEQQLRQVLDGDDADAMLLQALDQMDDEVKVPSDLGVSLSEKIDKWEAQEESKAKVVPLFWKRTAWAAAASVAVIAAVGWWLMRGGSKQVTPDNKPAIIAENVAKPSQEPLIQIVEPENDNVLLNQPSHPQPKPRSLRNDKPASVYKGNAEHLAQNLAQAKTNVQDEAQPSSDEEIAIAALEKFSTVLNKGIDQLDNANEKIENINNTIQQLI